MNLPLTSKTERSTPYGSHKWCSQGMLIYLLVLYMTTGSVGLLAAIPLPGRIEAESYNTGGNGVGYYDLTAGNSGGQYRNDDVDIQACPEGGYSISDTRTGEWLAYDINVTTAGYYDIIARVASQYNARRLRITIDDVNITGPIGFNATGGLQTYQDLTVESILLTAGNHVLKVFFDDWYIALNYLDVTPALPSAAISVPGRVEAEDFKRGGEGVGYHDATAGNSYYEYRTGDVDIQKCAEGGYNVGDMRTGEWLAYEIHVEQSGSYDLVARVATTSNSRWMHIIINDVDVTGPMVFHSTGGNQTYVNVTAEDVRMNQGTHLMKIWVDQPNFNLNYVDVVARWVVAGALLPGRIEAENYNAGGEGIGYHDLTAGNSGGQYRSDAVDIQACAEGGYNITDTRPGEWLAYNVYVAESGYYDIAARVASLYNGRKLHIIIDGIDVTGAIGFNSTGGSQIYQNLVAEGIPLAAGNHVLKVLFDDWYISLNYLEITPALVGTAIQVPGRIEAEDFRRGGAGVGYHDLTEGNSYYSYRTGDVDIQECAEGGYNVGDIRTGEWLAYEINVEEAGSYNLVARVATAYNDRRIRISVDGIDVTGSMTFNSTGGPQTYANVTAQNIYLPAGHHLVKILMEQYYVNLNYIEVQPATDAYLVQSGVANSEIVISNTAPRMVEIAAEELQYYIKKLTTNGASDGVTLPIVTTPTGGVPLKIYVGRSSYTDALGVTNAGLQNGAFNMVAGADWMVLLGRDDEFIPTEPYAHHSGDRSRAEADWDAITQKKFGLPFLSTYKNYNGFLDIWTADDRGSLNAVYEFLRNLGVRWYLPGEIGEVLPQIENIALPRVNRTVVPDFAMREWLQASGQRFNLATDAEIKWQLRLGLNDGVNLLGSTRGHGIGYVTQRAEVKIAHPEYFAFYNGVRLTTWGDGMGIPCLTSAGLFNENVDFVRKMFSHYDENAVNVSPADGFGYPAHSTGYMCQGVSGVCTCAGTARPSRGLNGALSDHVFDYVNRLAQEVYFTHPEKKVSTLAYGAYQLPPEDIATMSPNVIVILCRSRSDFEDPISDAEFQQITNDWLAKLPSGQLYIWDYYLHAKPTYAPLKGLPVLFPRIIANDLKFLKEKSVGEFVEVYRTYPPVSPDLALAANHLNMVVTSRLYWGVNQDLDTMLNEYYVKFYGPAHVAMKAFVEYAEANWHSAADPANPPSVRHHIMTQLKEKIQAAQTAAGETGIYRDRVDLLDDFLYQP